MMGHSLGALLVTIAAVRSPEGYHVDRLLAFQPEERAGWPEYDMGEKVAHIPAFLSRPGSQLAKETCRFRGNGRLQC